MDDLIVFSVFEITQHLKQVVETQIEPLYVRGEISNYTRHSSGHIYFNLKDPNSTLRCTFFRPLNHNLNFEPQEGMEVVCFGKLTVYEKGGSYNLNVQSMTLAGQGDLARQFEQLKKKLQAEGLFEQQYKKPLPRYPRRIGIVTSPTGAALQDMMNIISRRYPLEIDLYPALVQGSEAPAQLSAGVRYFNSVGEVDLIVLTRGGGSQEDLFCFNDEELARAIFASEIPVVSAVGHEIDFTIADFVADLRAPTPSAAAELIVPDRKDLLAYLSSLADRMEMAISKHTDRDKRRIAELKAALASAHPEKKWQSLQLRLDMAELELAKARHKMQNALNRYALRRTIAANSLQTEARNRLRLIGAALAELIPQLHYKSAAMFRKIVTGVEKLEIRLKSLSPFTILDQGYSMVLRENRVVNSIKGLADQELVDLRMKDGVAEIRIEKREALAPRDE